MGEGDISTRVTGLPVKLMAPALLAVGLWSIPQLAHAQTFAFYYCRDGTEFVVAFYQGRRAAYLKLDGKTITLPRRLAASGSRYVKDDVMFWIKGKTAILKRGRQSTECTTD
jgi:membrane-bound inhibitor of C-type lysozyme